MNQINLIGRITKDLELKQTNNGIPVIRFTVAVQKNNNSEQTNFINCEAWRKTAELIDKYFKKGNMIGITGELLVEQYQDDQGNNKSFTKVQVDKITFIDKKESNDNIDDSTDISLSKDDLPF